MKGINPSTNDQKREKRMKDSLEFLFQMTKEKFQIKKSSSFHSYSPNEYQKEYLEAVNRMDALPSSIDDYKNIQF